MPELEQLLTLQDVLARYQPESRSMNDPRDVQLTLQAADYMEAMLHIGDRYLDEGGSDD